MAELALLTAEEERVLAQRVADGDAAAVERFVVANLRLVLFVAKSHAGRGVPLDDLVQEGILGLMNAVQKFDPTKGFRFSTYAIWWIRQSITRAVAESSRAIRLPAHVWLLLTRANDVEQRLLQQLGRAPTLEEVAGELDLQPDKLAEIWRHRAAVASLDRPLGEDGASLADVLPDSPGGADDHSPEGTLLLKQRMQAVQALLETLSPRERQIICQRFGFAATTTSGVDSDGPCATLTEVAGTLGISRERVRQVERLALAKLRHRALHGRLRRVLLA